MADGWPLIEIQTKRITLGCVIQQCLNQMTRVEFRAGGLSNDRPAGVNADDQSPGGCGTQLGHDVIRLREIRSLRTRPHDRSQQHEEAQSDEQQRPPAQHILEEGHIAQRVSEAADADD